MLQMANILKQKSNYTLQFDIIKQIVYTFAM